MQPKEVLKFWSKFSEEDRNIILSMFDDDNAGMPAKAADEKADANVVESAENVMEDIKQDQIEGKPSESVAEDENKLEKALEVDEKADKAVESENSDDKSDSNMQDSAEMVAESDNIENQEQGDIIGALKARVAALEQENSVLRDKYEGEFGNEKPKGFGNIGGKAPSPSNYAMLASEAFGT